MYSNMTTPAVWPRQPHSHTPLLHTPSPTAACPHGVGWHNFTLHSRYALSTESCINWWNLSENPLQKSYWSTGINYDIVSLAICFTFMRIKYDVFRICWHDNNNLITGICIAWVITSEEIKNKWCSGLPREHCSDSILHVWLSSSSIAIFL